MLADENQSQPFQMGSGAPQTVDVVLGMPHTHSSLIRALERLGIPTSPFMNYWTLDELVRYYEKHTHENLP